MGRALAKTTVKISKVSVGSLLARKGLGHFVSAFKRSGRNQDLDEPRGLEWKRFPHALKVPVARTSNGCHDSVGPPSAGQCFLLRSPVPNLVEVWLPPSGPQGVLGSVGRAPPWTSELN
jgi:hypothetical protein